MKKKIIISIIIAVSVVAASLFIFIIINADNYDVKSYDGEVMRAFPAPYESMLAIVSDIDGSTVEEFEKYHKYLNTVDLNEIGEGLGLDIGDSYWVFMAEDTEDSIIDYRGNGNERTMTAFMGITNEYRNIGLVDYYFKCGWIDTMHTYGNFIRKDENDIVFSREMCEKALAEILRRDIMPTVWINHGSASNVQNIRNPSNKYLGFLGDSSTEYQKGGNPNSEYYHADITIAAGIKFIWFSKPNSKFGMNCPIYPVTLEDGQKVWGFHRYTGEDAFFDHNYNWSPYTLYKQITKERLDQIVENNQFALVSQHLGGGTEYNPFNEQNKEALLLLKKYEDEGKTLVARTSRLLEYSRVRDNLDYKIYHNSEGKKIINIKGIDDKQLGYEYPNMESLRGITFYDDENFSEIYIYGEKVSDDIIYRQFLDKEGRYVIGIKWFEKDTSNYIWGAQEYPHF